LNQNTGEKGFTFVELIVVIVIISILVAASATKFIDLSNSAQAGACRANQLALETAQTMYYTENILNGNSHYAESFDELIHYLQDETIPVCAGDGVYQILPDGKIKCSIAKHNR
jgi:prepilin-type N-terminal cleavage/methylation domain-containing protein